MANNEAYRRKIAERARLIQEAFEGRYKKQLNDLMGLSRAEVDRVTPDTTDLQAYAQLIEVVKEASRANIAQAELTSRIRDLGQVAIAIASKVPSLLKSDL